MTTYQFYAAALRQLPLEAAQPVNNTVSEALVRLPIASFPGTGMIAARFIIVLSQKVAP